MTWGPAALWAAVLFLLSSFPQVPGTSWVGLIPGLDKVGHFGLYFILGLALAWAGHRLDPGRHRQIFHVVLVLVGVAYGASDEWHQSFVPPRDVEVMDWVADSLGVTLGYLALRRRLARP